MARTANGMAIAALTATTMKGAAENTPPVCSKSTNQPAPMTTGGTTSTKTAPLSNKPLDEGWPRRAARHLQRAARHHQRQRQRDRQPRRQHRQHQAGHCRALDRGFARKPRQVGLQPGRDGRGHRPGHEQHGECHQRRVERRLAAARPGRPAGAETAMLASPVIEAPSRASTATTAAVRPTCSRVSATALAGSKSKRSAW